MLLLSRKTGEKIIIGSNIELTIIDIKDGQVRLGIQAPRDISVFRKELYKEVQTENQEATIIKEENILSTFKKETLTLIRDELK